MNALARAATELAVEAQSLAVPADFHALMLRRLQPLLGFDSAVCLGLAPVRSALAQLNKEQHLGLIRKVEQQPQLFEPELQRGRAAGQSGGGGYIDTEVFSASERRDRPFFAEVIRPQGIQSQLVGYLSFRGRSLAAMHLCRHGATRGFRRNALDALRQVLPVLGVTHVALAQSAPSPRLRSALTPREQELVGAVRHGLTNREIGLVLGSSPNTVRNQLHRLFTKLGVAGRTELAVWFEGEGS